VAAREGGARGVSVSMVRGFQERVKGQRHGGISAGDHVKKSITHWGELSLKKGSGREKKWGRKWHKFRDSRHRGTKKKSLDGRQKREKSRSAAGRQKSSDRSGIKRIYPIVGPE